MTARSVTFSEVPMWIQMWGLPFDLINDEEGLDIGKRLGRVVEVDKKTFSSDQARFIRVRVAIPLEKPIRRGGYVSNPKGDQVQIGFKYERLVGLCFQCGLFGHGAKECKKQKDPDQTATPYGDWFRAGYRRKKDGKNREPNSPPERDATTAARPKHDLRPRSQPQSKAITPKSGFGENHGNHDDIDGTFSKATPNQVESTEKLFKDNPCTKTK